MLEKALRIPFAVDLERLRADLAVALREPFYGHPSRDYYDGAWSAIALVSPGGRVDSLEVADEPYLPTPLLAHCPYFQEVLGRVPGETRRVRLLRVEPGTRVRAHCDDGNCVDGKVVRFHLAIETDPRATIVIGGSRFHFPAGELWYGDFALPHSVDHDGTRPRIHLVIDRVARSAVRSLFPREYLRAAPIRLVRRRLVVKSFYARALAKRVVGTVRSALA